MFCHNCGTKNTAEGVFCVKCGQKLSAVSNDISSPKISFNINFNLLKILSIVAIAVSGFQILESLTLISRNLGHMLTIIIFGFFVFFSIMVLLDSIKGINDITLVNFKLIKGLSIASIAVSGLMALLELILGHINSLMRFLSLLSIFYIIFYSIMVLLQSVKGLKK